MSVEPVSAPQSREVLTKAVLRAADRLDVPPKSLAAVLGVSQASLSRLRRSRAIDPKSKEGELALLFLRVFRSLDALLGGDRDQCRAWLHSYNHHLGGEPAELLRSVSGLVRVLEYLDAMRGPH